MTVAAPAKINLFLGVGARRADGYHPLATWMCTVGLSDELTFQSTRTQGFNLTADDRHLPVGPENLILRAAHAIAPHRPPHCRDGVIVTLKKRIPVGAGLGGGSSDAAHTLIALNQLWNLQMDATRMNDLAAGLGSDVPFFLHAPSAFCTGRGEVIHTLRPIRGRCCVLILPRFSLSTARVYAAFDKEPAPDGGLDRRVPHSPDLLLRWADLPSRYLLERLFNDLEPAAFSIRPKLGQMRDRLEGRLGRPVRMSGSGSTLFTLADDMEEGKELARIIGADGIKALAVKAAF